MTLSWFVVHTSLEFFPKTEIKFLKPLQPHTTCQLPTCPGLAMARWPEAQRSVLMEASPPPGESPICVVVCAFPLAHPAQPLTALVHSLSSPWASGSPGSRSL